MKSTSLWGWSGAAVVAVLGYGVTKFVVYGVGCPLPKPIVVGAVVVVVVVVTSPGAAAVVGWFVNAWYNGRACLYSIRSLVYAIWEASMCCLSCAEVGLGAVLSCTPVKNVC